MCESTRKLIIGWTGTVLLSAIVVGSITFYYVYGPRTDALTICATYKDARSSHFCVELAQAHSRQDQAR